MALRLCDLAGSALQTQWPKKYALNIWLSPEARARQCTICANIRREETGESPEAVKPEPQSRQSAVDPAQILAVNSESAVSDEGVSALVKKLELLRGSVLHPGSMVEILTGFAKNPPENSHGFVLTIYRFADRPGVTIDVGSKPGAPFAANARCDESVWHSLEHPENESPLLPDAQASLEEWSNPDQWYLVTSALDDALHAPPKSAFKIVVEFSAFPNSPRE
jgi:hypothetical protein